MNISRDRAHLRERAEEKGPSSNIKLQLHRFRLFINSINRFIEMQRECFLY